MNLKKTGSANLTLGPRILTWSRINPARLVMWLVAITIVSFAIGFGILALSGGISSAADGTLSPFRNSVVHAPSTTVIPVEGAGQGTVKVTMGAGKLDLVGGAPAGNLMEATVFSKAAEWQPDISRSLNGSELRVIITEKGHTAKEWFAVDSPNHWEIRMGETIPLNLDVNVGAGDSRLNLGTLNLTTLSVNNGAGDVRIDLGGYRGNRFDAGIVNGVGDVTLLVPRYSNTRIEIAPGFGDVSSTGLIVENESLTTPGYNPALPLNTIRIKQGVGSILVEAV